MVINTSALIAILLDEPDAISITKAIETSTKPPLISAFSMLEAGLVIHTRRGEAGVLKLDLLINRMHAKIVPFDSDQMGIARSAHQRYGKRFHKAALNIGDCCAYALAKLMNQPLLFKGNDFSKTDIQAVKY